MSKLYDLLSAVIAKIAKVAADTPAIDDTLTVKGAAADAAAVGEIRDEMTELKVDFVCNPYGNKYTTNRTFEEIKKHYDAGGAVVGYYATIWARDNKTVYRLEYIDESAVKFGRASVNTYYDDNMYVKTSYIQMTSDGVVSSSESVFMASGSIQPGVNMPVSGSTVYNYAVPIPSTASVGQTIAVKAVDDNGKPTEWEAVDLPKSAAVADAAGDTPTAEEFNALLAALRSAGLMAAE